MIQETLHVFPALQGPVQYTVLPDERALEMLQQISWDIRLGALGIVIVLVCMQAAILQLIKNKQGG